MKQLNNVISVRLTVIYISFIIVLLYWGDGATIIWILSCLILGNVRRIDKKGFLCRFIRMTLYFFPFLLPVIVFGTGKNIWSNSLSAVITPIIFGIVYWIVGRKGIRIILSTARLNGISIEKIYNPFLNIYNLIGAAIAEEIFFRYYLVGHGRNFVVSAVLSSVLFVCYHFTLEWGMVFSYKDFIRQFIIGIINCLLLGFYNSIMPCVILHLCCNLPEILMNLKIILLKKGIINCSDKQEIDIDF